MSDNIKKLREFLLKHIEQKKYEAQQIDKLIIAVKENQAANKIKSAVKSLALKKKETKSLAATTISKNYRKKMAVDEFYISLGDFLCTGLSQKEIYRKDILLELNIRGTPNVIYNLYLYYCKFGSKSLGYDKNYIIKKIVNSIFVNTGFKSTNFRTIHFKMCKFVRGLEGETHMNILKRKPTLRSEKKKSIYDTMEFDNTKLENCLFEECDFFGVLFKHLNIGSIIQSKPSENNKFIEFHGNERKIEATRFYKCNFKFRTIFQYPFNTVSYNKLGITDSKYNVKFNKVQSILGRGVNENVITLKRINSESVPHIVFEDCKFNNFDFSSTLRGNMNEMNSTLFLNCEFKCSSDLYNFRYLDFNEVTFKNCKFLNIHFYNINFKTCMFENCEINNCNFTKCSLVSLSCVIKNSKLTETKFVQCAFSTHANIAVSCLITSDCILYEVWFISCNLINFVFNYYSAILNSDEGKKNILQMKNCHFVCNYLFGTNFDYCNLEGGDFAERQNCREEINWLGKVFARMPDPSMLKGNKIPIKPKDLLYDCFGQNDGMMTQYALLSKPGIFIFKNADYTTEKKDPPLTGMYVNAAEFMTIKNIKPWDYFETYDGRYLYFVPPTSFNEANLKTCRFQSLDGFESFDFTKIAKDNSGKSSLNAANFTNVDLTNANMTNCNLIGTVFQVAKVTGVDFRDAVTNENTDFENTIDIGLALNADHINFGELQNNANETHARAQFIINNRNKYKEFYALCQDPARLASILNDTMSKTIEMMEDTIRIIKTTGNLSSERKRNLKIVFDKFIIMILFRKIKYSPEQTRKLKTDFQSIMTDEFVNILTNIQNPLQGGTPGKWCWLELVLDSLLFLFTCPNTYIFNFFEFYFFDIFNAHGVGGKSCTLGMVERLITVHCQVSEKFLMSMDLKPTPSIIDTLKHYNEGNPSAIDDEITEDFIIKFNDPSKLTPPNDCKRQLHKYALNKFVNLLKPNSTLPEEASDDFGFNFDYTIKPKWREEFQEAAKIELKGNPEKGDEPTIKNLDDLCEFYLIWMHEKILLENGLSSSLIYEIRENGGKKAKNLKEKLDELVKYLNEEEIPQFKIAIVVMTSEEATYEELVEYFEGGKKRKKTAKKGRGLLERARSFSFNKTKSLSSKRIQSAPAKLSLSKLNKLDQVLVKKFVELSKEKVADVFDKMSLLVIKFYPKNMSIQDQVYREILEKKVQKIKNKNLLLKKNMVSIKNYKKSIKTLSKKSKSSKKTIKVSKKGNTI